MDNFVSTSAEVERTTDVRAYENHRLVHNAAAKKNPRTSAGFATSLRQHEPTAQHAYLMRVVDVASLAF